MRWLAPEPGPNFSVQDVHVGYVEALRAAGEHVIISPFGSMLSFYDAILLQAGANEFRKALTGEQATAMAVDRLAGALYKTRPDVLLLTSGFFIDHQLLDLARRDGVQVVALLTEQPYEHARELELAKHCDLVLLTDPMNIADFAQVTRAVHAPHCYRPGVHRPGPVDPVLECDFAFVGTGYPSRIGFFEAMDLGDLDVLLAGNWQALGEESPLRGHVGHGLDECMPNERTVQIYRSARVGINLYRREAETAEPAQGWAVGPREIEMAAIGLPFLRDPRPEGDDLFPSLPTFTCPAEASELLRWWLTHPGDRVVAGAKAREAIADRTFDNAAARLLRHIERSRP